MQMIKKNISSVLFGSFMFLQFALLGLGNHAGEGWLSDSRRERPLRYYMSGSRAVLFFAAREQIDFCIGYMSGCQLLCKSAVVILYGAEYGAVLGNGFFGASFRLEGIVPCFFDIVMEIGKHEPKWTAP